MTMPTELRMDTAAPEARSTTEMPVGLDGAPTWLYNLHVLWHMRRVLIFITGGALVFSLAAAFMIPKIYVSQARIMPPETPGLSSTLLTALAGRAIGNNALGGLAMSLVGDRGNGSLFVDLLHSASVSNSLIARFQLQSVYHKRYRIDTAKVLARRTRIDQDKKSGVITLAVEDTDPFRARDLAQAYLDELNIVVNRASRSSAHQERVFIEGRLLEVKSKLSRAEEALSEFSSANTAIDLKEQARATVESEARAQGELIAAQTELDSLEQIYGDGNVRVREAVARIASLKRELEKMGGSPAPISAATTAAANPAPPYLPLRQVPRLAVPYANFYREVQVQETVYNLLIQQYELARIQEAEDIPAVNVIDVPGVPEKKSFPPRLLFALVSTLLVDLIASLVLLGRHYWSLLDPADPRKRFAPEVEESFRPLHGWIRNRRVQA